MRGRADSNNRWTGALVKERAAAGVDLGRRPTTLVAGEAQTPATKLFVAGAVLLAEVIDRGPLTTIDQTGEREERELARLRAVDDPGILWTDESSDTSG